MKELKSTVKRTGLLASSLLCSALLMAVPFRKELNEGWKFKQARLTNWYPATVPGVIHTDLLANKIIEDPFFRLNERGLQWIDKEDWIYETTFLSRQKSCRNKLSDSYSKDWIPMQMST